MDTNGTTRPTSDDPAAAAVMDLLSRHVPLSLLLDLCLVDGPRSWEILEAEGSPAQTWWAA